MTGHRIARTITFLCAAIPLACSDSLAPGDVLGTYVLHNVAGDALPTVLYTTDYATIRVFADTLRFAPDGRGSINTLRESEPVKGDGPTEAFRWQTGFAFKLIDDRIEVTFDCPPNADCVRGPHLVLRGIAAGLRADVALGARVPLFYKLVDRGR
jgi:hypothetical protein